MPPQDELRRWFGNAFFPPRQSAHGRGHKKPPSSNLYTIKAPADSSTDVTQTIKDEIATVPDGWTIRFPVPGSQGKYRIDWANDNIPGHANNLPVGIFIQNRNNLTIEGPSAADPAVFYSPTEGPFSWPPSNPIESKRTHWWIHNCDGLTLRNLRVEGPNDIRKPVGDPDEGYPYIVEGWEAEHAFFFPVCDNLLVEDCSAFSVYGDAFGLWSVTGQATGDNLTFRRCRATEVGRHGFGIDKATNLLIDDFIADKAGSVGIDMEPNFSDAVIDGVEISNCTLDVRSVAIAAAGLKAVNNVNIHDITIINGPRNTEPAVKCIPQANNPDPLVRASGWTLTNVNRTHAWTTGINGAFKFVHTDDIAIDNPDVNQNGSVQSPNYCVQLDGCGGTNSVKNGDFHRANILLRLLNSTPEPTHCGNVWDNGTQNDGAC